MPLSYPQIMFIKDVDQIKKKAQESDNTKPQNTKIINPQDNTQRTLKKIKSSENFLKYQWAWTL